MQQVELLHWINSGLLTLMGILLGVLSFFLRDLHRDYKGLRDKVGELGGKISEVQHEQSLLAQALEFLKTQLKPLFKKTGKKK